MLPDRIRFSVFRRSFMFKSLSAAVALLFVCTSLRAQSLQLFPIKNFVTYDRNSNTLTVAFGYKNNESSSLNVPFGSSNIMLPAPFFRGQVTRFDQGTYSNVFQVTFSADSYLEWTLGETPVRASMADLSPIQYQGRLSAGGVPTNGLVEFQFSLFDDATNGTQVLNTQTFEGASAIAVTNGLFNTILLWDGKAFTTSPRWLEIHARMQGETNYVTLSPRQPLTVTPYAANAQYLGGFAPTDYVRQANFNFSAIAGSVSDASLSSNVALLDNAQTFTGAKTFNAAMKLGPVIARGSFPGRLEIEQGNVNEPALRLSSTSSGHGSGLWLENRSGSVNTWTIYTESSGKLVVGKQELAQDALTINPSNLNVTVISLSQTSDRNAKENFGVIDPVDVLEKVAGLDIKRWNFKGDTNTEHIGPMAQDFYAAFGTGTDERHIATVDADGVALAAIQGLNKKLSDKEAEIETLRRANEKLADRLQQIEEKLKTRE